MKRLLFVSIFFAFLFAPVVSEAGQCVFSPKKGKYVKCNSFSMGKCKAGSQPCKP